eukprot:901332-Prorocentrum_minimum.AAC.1
MGLSATASASKSGISTSGAAGAGVPGAAMCATWARELTEWVRSVAAGDTYILTMDQSDA